jgi:hypothetical protein
MNTDQTNTDVLPEMKNLKTSFIGKTSEYINKMLNTVLDDPVLLRVAIRF